MNSGIQKKIILMAFFIAFTCGLFSIESLSVPVGRNIIIDETGCLYTDLGNHQIAKFSKTGEELFQIGRKGEGPGDIKRLGWFEINPKNSLLYVTEFYGGNKWISRFSLDGKFVDLWKCDIQWGQWGAASKIDFDEQGCVYVEMVKQTPRQYKTFTVFKSKRSIIKFSPKGKKLTTIYTFEADFNAEAPGKGNITIPYSNYLYWNLAGDRILVRESYSENIRVYNTNGKEVRKLPIPFKRTPLTDKDLNTWEHYLRTRSNIKNAIKSGIFDMKLWRKDLPFPKYKPVSGAPLFTDGKEFVYSKKASGYSETSNTWAKVSLHTGKSEIIRFPLRRILIKVKGDYFYFAEPAEDDDDIDYRVLIIHKDEKGLLRLK